MSYLSTCLADSPAAFWLLNETTGTSATDSSGHSKTGTYTGTHTLGVTGPPGAGMGGNLAVSLNGGYVYNSSMSSAASESLECWFQTSTVLGGGITEIGDTVFVIYMLNNGKVSVGIWDGTTANVATSTSAYNDGNWHYAAATYNSGTTTMTLYINGSSVASLGTVSTIAGGDASWYAGNGGNTASNWPGTSSNTQIVGNVADAAYYVSALTSTQITNHWNASSAGGAVVPGTVKTVQQAIKRASLW